jgi:hypothetical protein
MAAGIGRLFPGCPPERAEAIARQAGRKVAVDDEAVVLAVLASVRHEDTAYDELLMAGVPREEARERVQATVHRVMTRWRLHIVRG